MRLATGRCEIVCIEEDIRVASERWSGLFTIPDGNIEAEPLEAKVDRAIVAVITIFVAHAPFAVTWAEVAKHDEQVDHTDEPVAIEIGRAVSLIRARAPRPQHREQVRKSDLAIAVDISFARIATLGWDHWRHLGRCDQEYTEHNCQ